jgi:hypothetical protein
MWILVLGERTIYVTDICCCWKSMQPSRQAECVVTGNILWDPEKGFNCKEEHTQCIPVKLWLQWVVSLVIFASAAGWRMVSAVGGLLDGSGWPLVDLADNIASRSLTVTVCTWDEWSWGKSNSKWLVCWRSTAWFALASDAQPSGCWWCCDPCWLVGVLLGPHTIIWEWSLASIFNDASGFKMVSHLRLIMGLCGKEQETKPCLKHLGGWGIIG